MFAVFLVCLCLLLKHKYTLARQAAIPPPRFSVTVGAFTVGVLVSACSRRNRCENDVEMLQNDTRYLAEKTFKIIRKIGRMTSQNRLKNEETFKIIRKSTKKRLKIEGKTSLERLRRRSLPLGGENVFRQNSAEDFWGPFLVRKSRKIEKNTIRKKHENTGTQKHGNVC